MSNNNVSAANGQKQDPEATKPHIDYNSLLTKKNDNEGLISPSEASETGDLVYTSVTGSHDGLYPPTDETIDDGLRSPEDVFSQDDKNEIGRMKDLINYGQNRK